MMLAKLGDPRFPASLVVAGLVVVVGAVAFALLRGRWRWIAPIAAALLVVGAFAPAPRPLLDGRVEGEATGETRIPLRLLDDARLRVTGGGGEMAGQDALLHCAARCAYVVEHARLAQRRGAGNATLADVELICFTSPPTLLLVGGLRCVTCSTTRLLLREGAIVPDPEATASAVC